MKMAFFHDSKFKYDKNNDYYTSGGLNDRFLKEYLNYFEKITLITRKEKINKSEDISKYSLISLNDVQFDCLDSLNIFSIFFGKSNKIIKKNIINNDYIIIRLPSIIGIKACQYCNKYKKKYLIEMVGCPFDSLWNYGGIKAKLIAPILTLITKILVKKSKNVLYVSNVFLQKRYPNNKNTIGVSDVKIDKPDKKILDKRIKKINSYDENTIYKFGLIGSLKINYKGHDTAIKALSRLKDKINFELHFLGSSDDRSINKWKQLATKYGIEKNIYFDGVLPGGKPVFNWMDDMDFYLIPSLQEGLPRALVEAMSRASVCIGAKTGGIVELLESDSIIRRKDDKAMSILIDNLIGNKSKMIDVATRNFNFSRNYEEEKLLLKRRKFYKDTLK